jgi:ferritin-like metal-binding protein YciE
MPDQTARDAKLAQYLNDAYATERRLEVALQTHIDGTTRADYLKRLKQHLKETKSHATEVERRIRQLGGTAELVGGPDALGRGAEAAQSAVQRATAAVKKPLQAVMGVGEQERMLKNARTEFEDEAKEIATYRLIDAMATAVGDKDTAKLARKILREEQRMADFLTDLIPQLAVDTVHDAVPVAEIEGPAARRTAAAGATPARPTTAARSRGAKPKSSSTRSSGSKSTAGAKSASKAAGTKTRSTSRRRSSS